jgi:hypothetical protein
VYAKEIDEHKRTMLLVNKADLLPLNIRSAPYLCDLLVWYLYYCLSSDIIAFFRQEEMGRIF